MAENVMKLDFFFFGCQSHIVQRLTAFEKNADMTLTTKSELLCALAFSVQRAISKQNQTRLSFTVAFDAERPL